MTAEEWEQCPASWMLIGQLACRVGLKRKRRLFLCGCARVLFPGKTSPVEEWIDTAERFADGLATHHERQTVNRLARDRHRLRVHQAWYAMVYWATLRDASQSNLKSAVYHVTQFRDLADTVVCDLVRDIFGNPFRPAAFDHQWRTSTAVALAQQIYDSRDFSAMPILADALQDAGCNNDDILDHCRAENAIHVRGCWVVDLVLGKA
jgi:hypothetical protein